VGADLFANAVLFAKHRDRLLESYALDCISHGAARERVALPGRGAAGDFLRLALRATYDWRGSPGLGRLLTVGGAHLSGSALVYRQSVLHAYLVRQEVVIIRPPHPPHPIPLPGPMRED